VPEIEELFEKVLQAIIIDPNADIDQMLADAEQEALEIIAANS